MTKILIAALLASAAMPASATVLLNNLSQPDSSSNYSSDLTTARNKAIGFTMGATAFALDTAVLRLRGSSGLPGAVALSLYSNSVGNNPGTALASFSGGSSVTALGNYTFTSTASYILQAQTTYWLELVGTSNNGVDWMGSDATVNPSTSFATYFGARFDDNGAPATGGSSTVNTLQLNGTSLDVPEPAMLGLFGLGAIGLGLARRRRG